MSDITETARLFWRWGQLKIRGEALVSLEEAIVDSSSIEALLFARVGESAIGRFPDCNFNRKTIRKCWYFGKNAFFAVSQNGVLLRYRLVRASTAELRGLAKLNSPKFRKVTGDSGYRGHKGYDGQKIALTKPWGAKTHERKLASKRSVLERVINLLKDLGFEGSARVKTARSLDSQLTSVLACVSAIQYLNLKRGRSPLSYKAFLL